MSQMRPILPFNWSSLSLRSGREGEELERILGGERTHDPVPAVGQQHPVID